MGGWQPELDRLCPNMHSGLPPVKIESKGQEENFVQINGQNVALPWPFIAPEDPDTQVIDLSL